MPIADPVPTPKPDNLLGICHAIGEAFGFNPLYLRLALTIGALASFEAAVIAYLVLGVAVLAGAVVHRLSRPSRKSVEARPVVEVRELVAA